VAVEVVLPMLGITVERGKIVEWLKKEGDPVEKGEIIFIVKWKRRPPRWNLPPRASSRRFLSLQESKLPF